MPGLHAAPLHADTSVNKFCLKFMETNPADMVHEFPSEATCFKSMHCNKYRFGQPIKHTSESQDTRVDRSQPVRGQVKNL